MNLLKPPGMTSHDAVAFVRRVTGIKRVGHTGTLDPAAAGVLPICIGHATRLVEYLQAGTKEYLAEATFGYETDTLDAVGEVISEGAAAHVTLETVRAANDAFRGTIQQMPPLYSAIKKEGQKLYELARAGADANDLDIQTREVTITRLTVNHFWEATPNSPPRALLGIECSGGTYIRSLVRDIGRALGCGATMTFLVRTRSGSFTLNEAVPLEQIAQDAAGVMLPLLEVLTWCAGQVVINDEAAENLMHGRQVQASISKLVGYQQDPIKSKQRLTQAVYHNKTNPQRVLFLNKAATIAALADPVSPNDTTWYKAEKVFNLGLNE
ncbi:MAG: tRNA pseudouridine(55) synthase TruB [Abitibacteriaceae bacterium]|nr:tRNA pseudouridine(55) synthase TruB [Abditibacteriaceae bacterium]